MYQTNHHITRQMESKLARELNEALTIIEMEERHEMTLSSLPFCCADAPAGQSASAGSGKQS